MLLNGCSLNSLVDLKVIFYLSEILYHKSSYHMSVLRSGRKLNICIIIIMIIINQQAMQLWFYSMIETNECIFLNVIMFIAECMRHGNSNQRKTPSTKLCNG